jgi:membrane protein YdbS with pleckstrin-like domain
VAIPGLLVERADDVQETLRRLAIESEPDEGEGDAV